MPNASRVYLIPTTASPPQPQPETLTFALAPPATVVLPGPAPGYVRFYTRAIVLADVIATPVTGLSGVLRDAAAVDWSIATQTTAATAIQLVATLCPLFEGETYRVTASGGGTGRINCTYVDIPRGTLTPIRVTLNGITPVIVVPEPAAGFESIFAIMPEQPQTQNIETTRCVFCNLDTAAAGVWLNLGANTWSRTATTAAGTAFSTFGFDLALAASPGNAISVRTIVAPTLNQPLFLGAYETRPATP